MRKVYICPSDKRHNCSWEGDVDDIYEHFILEHEDLLRHTNDLEFDLQVKSENILLFYEDEIYLVQQKIMDDILFIKLRFLGVEAIADKITYNIKLDLDQDDLFSVIARDGSWEINMSQAKNEVDFLENIRCSLIINKCELETNEIITVEATEQVTTEAEKEPTKRVQKNNSYTLGTGNTRKFLSRSLRHRSVILVKDNSVLEKLPPLDLDPLIPSPKRLTPQTSINKEEEYTEKDLPCTTCEKVMLPPIFLCENGHNICVTCKKTSCKSCSKSVTDNRNENLEHVSRSILHPCKYSVEGCKDKFYYNELRGHETKCAYCTFFCPIKNCPTRGTFSIFVNHIRVFHKDIKIQDSLLNECPRNTEFFVVDIKKGIFYVFSELKNEIVEWQVIFCGPRERQFFCELYFKNSKDKDKIYFKRNKEKYTTRKHLDELKKMKVKDKNAVLEITSYD